MVNGQGLIRQIIYCIILTSISHFSSGTLKADEDCKLVQPESLWAVLGPDLASFPGSPR